MQVLLADYDPGSLTAFYLFVGAGFLIALALVGAGVTTLRKDHKSARFYFIAAAVCAGVALMLVVLALIFGKDLHLL